MKGYKAFDKGLICRGKQYAENTVFEEEKAEICKSGMHFCKNPLDVLDYYPLVNDNGDISEFAEVEALCEVLTDDKKKYCTKKLKIGAKLSFAQLVQASVKFELDVAKETKVKTTSKDSAKIGSSGYSAKIGSSGDSAKIGSSGYSAKIGSSGNSAKIGSSGDSAKIGSSGNYAKIGSSGNYAKIGSSGNYAQINSTGKNAVVMCAGNESIAKAKIGSWITLAEWKIIGGVYTPVCVKTEKVDGERIKEDTYYKLVDGEFVEAIL
jgi:hypothetical protein